MEEREAASSSGGGGGSEELKGGCRGHWRPDEDEKLRRLVQKYGPRNWNFIAQRLHGRSGKSCRLRWFNQLDPRVKKTPFTSEEEHLLLSAHRIYGNKWSLIARFFPGRTDNAVKNHWHVITAPRRRRCPPQQASSSSLTSDGSFGGERDSMKRRERSDLEGCFGFLSHGRTSSDVVEEGVRALPSVPFIDFLGVGITS